MFSFDLDALVADVKEFSKRVHYVDELFRRSSAELKEHFAVRFLVCGLPGPLHDGPCV